MLQKTLFTLFILFIFAVLTGSTAVADSPTISGTVEIHGDNHPFNGATVGYALDIQKNIWKPDKSLNDGTYINLAGATAVIDMTAVLKEKKITQPEDFFREFGYSFSVDSLNPYPKLYTVDNADELASLTIKYADEDGIIEIIKGGELNSTLGNALSFKNGTLAWNDINISGTKKVFDTDYRNFGNLVINGTGTGENKAEWYVHQNQTDTGGYGTADSLTLNNVKAVFDPGALILLDPAGDGLKMSNADVTFTWSGKAKTNEKENEYRLSNFGGVVSAPTNGSPDNIDNQLNVLVDNSTIRFDIAAEKPAGTWFIDQYNIHLDKKTDSENNEIENIVDIVKGSVAARSIDDIIKDGDQTYRSESGLKKIGDGTLIVGTANSNETGNLHTGNLHIGGKLDVQKGSVILGDREAAGSDTAADYIQTNHSVGSINIAADATLDVTHHSLVNITGKNTGENEYDMTVEGTLRVAASSGTGIGKLDFDADDLIRKDNNGNAERTTVFVNGGTVEIYKGDLSKKRDQSEIEIFRADTLDTVIGRDGGTIVVDEDTVFQSGSVTGINDSSVTKTVTKTGSGTWQTNHVSGIDEFNVDNGTVEFLGDVNIITLNISEKGTVKGKETSFIETVNVFGGMFHNEGNVDTLNLTNGLIENAGTICGLTVSGGTFRNTGTIKDLLNPSAGSPIVSQMTGGLIENAGTIEQLTVQDGMLKNETNASVTDLTVSGGTVSGTAEIGTLNYTSGTLGTKDDLFSQNQIGVFNIDVTNIAGYAGKHAGEGNMVEKLNVTNNSSDTSSTNPLTVSMTDTSVSVNNQSIGKDDDFITDVRNVTFHNTAALGTANVSGGTFYNEGNVNTLNLTGGTLTGSGGNITKLHYENGTLGTENDPFSQNQIGVFNIDVTNIAGYAGKHAGEGNMVEKLNVTNNSSDTSSTNPLTVSMTDTSVSVDNQSIGKDGDFIKDVQNVTFHNTAALGTANVSGGTFHNAGNVDTLNLTGGLIENAGSIEQLTVQGGMLKNETNASVTDLNVSGGMFHNAGNVDTLNLTGGKLTGTSKAHIVTLNTGQNGVFDAAAYAGSSDEFSVTGGTLLITAGGDESQYTFSKVNVRQSVTLKNAKIQVNAGDILTLTDEFTLAKLNEVYEIIKGQYDDKAFFDAAVGENITADLTSLWLNAGGKNMTVSKNDAENNTFSGKAEGIGTLTLQSGTLYLAGLETGTQIQAGSLVIENGALKSAAGINLGGSKKYTNVIQLTDSQTDIAGTVAKLNSNSSTALSKNMWSINGNHLDLTVETLTVGQFIEKQGKKLSGNAALIASVFDDVSVRQASKSANSLLARALPEYEYAEYRDSNGNELPGAVRTALENLGTDDAVNEAIHHALAGELAGNALRSASGPYRTVFRQHLDGLTLNRRSITQAVFPAEAQKTESPAAARPAAPLPAALPPRLTPRNTSGSKRDTGDLLLGQSGSSGIISMWFTPFVQSENADGDAVTYDGYKLSRSGFLVGGDYLIGHYAAAGAVFGYTDPTVKSTLGKITADDFSFGLYGRVPIFWGINTNMMIGFGSQSYTYANGAARSEFGGSSFFGSIEFSKKFYRQKISFMPLLAVDFQSAKMDEFNVTDHTLGNIAVAPGDFAATSLRLGLLGSYNGFHARLQYIRQMAGDDYVDSRTVFANYTGAAADIRSIRFGKDTVNFGIGGDILQTRRFKLSADYDLEAGTNITAHTGSLTAAVKW